MARERKPTMKELAARINAHLTRMEADPAINQPIEGRGLDRLLRYHRPFAFSSGRFVYVCYVRYQGSRHLSRTEAERYLAALDAGYNGKHWHVVAWEDANAKTAEAR